MLTFRFCFLLVVFVLGLPISSVLGSTRNSGQQSRSYVTFWENEAKKIDWFKKWSITEEQGFPFVRWFKGGKLNVCYNCLDRHVKAGLGDKVAFYWENERGAKKVWTYREILEETKKLANVYKSLGLKKGDRVSIYMPMVPESIVAMLAATRVGLVHNFIFGGIGGGSVKERINDSESVLLVTADGGFRRGKTINYKKTVDEILDDCPTIKHTLVLKYNGENIAMKRGRDIWYHEAMSKASTDCPCEPMDSEDMMFLLYTSGTTGKPKGLIHTTGGYLVGVNSTYRLVFDPKPTDVYWCTADPGWITGHSFAVYGPMCSCVTQFMYEGALDYPNKDQFSKFIERYHITTFYTAPTFISMLMKWGVKDSIGSHNLSSLRLIGSIGETLKPEVWEWYNKNVGQFRCPIVDTWFQTETGSFVISPIPWVTKLKPGSVTKALPGYTVDILDEEGNSVKKGLLAIKKPFPSMMRGIYKDNERYLKTYWSKWNGKYYYAGDNASKDADGYIYVSGRADEILKVSGHRIGTAEIEASIMEDKRVAEAAVIGIDDKIKGTSVLAYVVIKKEYQLNDIGIEKLRQELTLSVKKDLGSYAKPDHIVFVPQVPKNRSGKVLRRVLKSIFEEKDYGNTETLVNPSAIKDVNSAVKKYKGKRSRKNFFSSKYFRKIEDEANLSAEEIVKVTRPIIADHLANQVYNRVYPISQFLDFWDAYNVKNTRVSPLDVLKEFDLEAIILSKRNTGPCFVLANNFFDSLPAYLNAHLISAKMSKQFQQPGYHQYSHVAIVIHYRNPQNGERGIVLLDPNFDVPIPLVFNDKKRDASVYMGKKRGVWNFHYNGDNVTCLEGNGDKMLGSDSSTEYYVNYEVISPYRFAFMPLIASDMFPAIVSRDSLGRHVAHLKINLAKRSITRSIDGKYLPLITFDDFLKNPLLGKQFCSRLRLPERDVSSAVEKIVRHADVLNRLRKEFYEEGIKNEEV